MKSPFVTTLLMGLMAATAAATASWYYPWPEMVERSDRIGKPLFESFEAKDVRRITVVEFDPTRNDLKQIELRRSGETWLLPGFQNYIANNPTQISMALNSVNANVLEQRANETQDHVEYGVVDPAEFATPVPRNSLGRKIVLHDRNNVELASLIVGSAPQDPSNQRQNRRFVRITGEPAVYTAEVPPSGLSTNFADWIDSNLLQINPDIPGETLMLNRYRVPADKIDDPAAIQWDYQLKFDLTTQQPSVRKNDQAPRFVELEQSQANLSALSQAGMLLSSQLCQDVRRKPQSVINALKNPQSSSLEVLKPLNSFGIHAFNQQSGNSKKVQFQGTHGSLIITTVDGVSVQMVIGSPVDSTNLQDNSDGHLMMLLASFDASRYPQPESISEDADDQTKRAYLRQVEDRKQQLELIQRRVEQINEEFANWFYVMPAATALGLLPELILPPFDLVQPEQETKPQEADSGAAKSNEADSIEAKSQESESVDEDAKKEESQDDDEDE